MSLTINGAARSDEALMARARNGDTDAFGELYDRHAVRAFRVARAICRHTRRAEEAVQEGFLAIWAGRAQFSPGNGSFKAWSMGIVMDQAIDAEPKPVLDQVIALAYFGELSHSEIAALLHLPSGAVKGRMRLGLEKLRKQMGVLT